MATPFRDTAKRIADKKDYITMSVECKRARSHSWWKNVVEYGAWQGPGEIRVGPPDPEAIRGIAKLFEMTAEQVSAMVAADWYGVLQNGVPAQALRLAPALEDLGEADVTLLENLAHRLASAAAA